MMVLDMQKKLEDKQNLEVEIDMEGGDDRDKMEAMRTLLEEKEIELDDLDELNTTLLAKDNRAHIGVKRMGEVDLKAFEQECKKKYPKDYEIKAVEIASSWDASLQDPNWFPFKWSKRETTVSNGEDDGGSSGSTGQTRVCGVVVIKSQTV
ncbi:Factor of DNA methylation 2 [Nymphaea thermarum]|nr:Factor of DNA methylation 2 [Nymphaea thermarum]